MSTFPVKREDSVTLGQCDDSVVVEFPFLIGPDAAKELTLQVRAAVKAIAGSGTGEVLKKISETVFGNSSAFTLDDIVQALAAAVQSLTPVEVVSLWATDCCPADRASIQRLDLADDAQPVALGPSHITARWTTGESQIRACPCRGRDVGGGMVERTWGTCKSQVFYLTWTVTIAFDAPRLKYSFPAQINKVRVNSPCCCPALEAPPPSDKPGPGKEPRPRRAKG